MTMVIRVPEFLREDLDAMPASTPDTNFLPPALGDTARQQRRSLGLGSCHHRAITD